MKVRYCRIKYRVSQKPIRTDIAIARKLVLMLGSSRYFASFLICIDFQFHDYPECIVTSYTQSTPNLYCSYLVLLPDNGPSSDWVLRIHQSGRRSVAEHGGLQFLQRPQGSYNPIHCAFDNYYISIVYYSFLPDSVPVGCAEKNIKSPQYTYRSVSANT